MERVVQGLAEAQAKLGHEVHVLTSNCSTAKQEFEILNGVKVHRLKSRRLLKFPDLTIPLTIPEELLTSADVVHVHGHNSLFSRKVLKKAKQLGVKTACYFMAVDAFSDHPNLGVRTFAPYYGKRNTHKSLAATDIVLVKSFRDLEVLKNAYAVNATYLPDAVNTNLLTVEKELVDFKQKFEIRQRYYFLFIGRMHKLKGPQVLVNALKYAPAAVAAVFIGPDDGYLRETLSIAEKLGVKERTYALGFVDEASKIAAIDSSVALVLPSVADYVEVYPGVISEAWAREKPVIASNVGGIPFRVRDHVNGLLVKPSNPEMLANSMLEILDNPSLAKELGGAGKFDVFSWEVIAKKSIELYSVDKN